MNETRNYFTVAFFYRNCLIDFNSSFALSSVFTFTKNKFSFPVSSSTFGISGFTMQVSATGLTKVSFSLMVAIL